MFRYNVDRGSALLHSAELRSDLFQSVRRRIKAEEAFVIVRITAGSGDVGRAAVIDADGSIEGDLGIEGWKDAVVGPALDLLGADTSDSIRVPISGEDVTVFCESMVPPPRLIIVGAAQTAQSLTRLAKELGYRVVVTDARATFVTRERFPEADEVIKGWPQDILPNCKMDDSTYIVLLSHDPKFDEPTLQFVLRQPVRYIGAIGSRTTQVKRREKLRSQGFTQEEVARIHGPVGLDLGGKGAEEVALSILAEMTAVRYGRAGGMNP